MGHITTVDYLPSKQESLKLQWNTSRSLRSRFLILLFWMELGDTPLISSVTYLTNTHTPVRLCRNIYYKEKELFRFPDLVNCNSRNFLQVKQSTERTDWSQSPFPVFSLRSYLTQTDPFISTLSFMPINNFVLISSSIIRLRRVSLEYLRLR